MAWMEASWIFNFRAEQIQENNIADSGAGVSAMLTMLRNTVRNAHAKAPEALPLYEKIAQNPAAPAQTQEKLSS